MREEEWKKDIAREYSIYALPSWLPGVWPLLPDNFFTAFRFYIAVILLFSTILTLGSEIIQNCGDARQMTDQLVFCAVTLNSTTKTILLRIFRRKVSNNYREAEKDWSTTEDKNLLEIMESHTKLSRKVYFFEAAVHYTLLTMYMIAPKLSEEEQILPLLTPCLAKNISDIGYQSFYFLQTLQAFYVFNGNVGTDFFFFAIIMHICGQVEILRIKLSRIANQDFNYETENEENFGESTNNLRQRNVDEKECSNRMNALIERHVKLINLANDMQNTLSITLLVQLSNSILIMCTLGLQSLLFLQVGDTVSAGRTTSGFIIVAIGLYLYCYMGDYLQYQFEKVSEAAYNCHWYNFPPKLSRNVVNIQMRASRFINLSAGKMCDMNLEMFKAAMKTAMSFFSVMRIVFEKEDKII